MCIRLALSGPQESSSKQTRTLFSRKIKKKKEQKIKNKGWKKKREFVDCERKVNPARRRTQQLFVQTRWVPGVRELWYTRVSLHATKSLARVRVKPTRTHTHGEREPRSGVASEDPAILPPSPQRRDVELSVNSCVTQNERH